MKKLYVLLFALLLGTGAFAQISINQEIEILDPSLLPSRPQVDAGIRSGQQLWLEYDTADNINFGVANLHTIQWVMNKRYKMPANANTFQYYVVRFDSLYDLYTSPSAGVGIDRSTVNNITVDSIYAVIGHQNISGTADTLILKILNLTAARYPGTTVLWADTFITTTSLSPGGVSWKVPVKIQWEPNYSNAMNGFAVALEYYGSFSDTCAFVAGFNNAGSSGSLCPYRASLSNFYPNSFVAWTNYSSSYPLLPHTDGTDLTQDCNQNGSFDPSTDGYNFLQDVLMGAYITINSSIGVEDLKNTGISLSQNIPNPLHNTTEIKYELASNVKDVTLYVYDIVGSKIMEVNEGNRSQGKYSISLDASKLSKGMYIYTLRADGSQLTRRMIVE